MTYYRAKFRGFVKKLTQIATGRYSHRYCKGNDPCPNCGHSVFVFHGGDAPCFHIDENHEEMAFMQNRKVYNFCECTGTGKK